MYIKKTPLLHPSDHTYPISTYRAHTPLLHYLHWTASLRRRVLLHRCTHITYESPLLSGRHRRLWCSDWTRTVTQTAQDASPP